MPDFSRGPRAGYVGPSFCEPTPDPVPTNPDEPAQVRVRLSRTWNLRNRLSHRRLAE